VDDIQRAFASKLTQNCCGINPPNNLPFAPDNFVVVMLLDIAAKDDAAKRGTGGVFQCINQTDACVKP
jgi:hypothetical protein